MKHGFIQIIIDFFKGLHTDTLTFIKGAAIGGAGSAFILLNAKIGDGNLALATVAKFCYIGATALLSGMFVTIGKKIVNSVDLWWKKRKAKKEQPSQKHNFSKNGRDQNQNTA